MRQKKNVYLCNPHPVSPATIGVGLAWTAEVFEGTLSAKPVVDFSKFSVLAVFLAFPDMDVWSARLHHRGKRSARAWGLVSAFLGLILLDFSLAVIFNLLPVVEPLTFPTPMLRI